MRKAEQWAPLAIRQSVQCVWPGARVHRVEDESHPACLLLDQACGIDWLVEYQGFIKGLSVRCQKFSDYQYCCRVIGAPTFTIRNLRVGRGYTTQSELDKTIQAEQSGAITAAYQLHAYMNVNDGDATHAVAWGLARRVPLFQWVRANEDKCVHKKASDEIRRQQQLFIAVPFNVLPPDILHRSYPDNYAAEDMAGDEVDQDTALNLDALAHQARYLYQAD